MVDREAVPHRAIAFCRGGSGFPPRKEKKQEITKILMAARLPGVSSQAVCLMYRNGDSETTVVCRLGGRTG